MSKQVKFLLALITLCLVLVIYVIISAQVIGIPEEKATRPDSRPIVKEKMEKVDLKKMENNYTNEARKIFAKTELILENMIATSTVEKAEEFVFTADDVKSIKDSFMDLVLPELYMDFHLDLALALTKLEEYLLDGKSESLNKADELIDKARLEALWL